MCCLYYVSCFPWVHSPRISILFICKIYICMVFLLIACLSANCICIIMFGIWHAPTQYNCSLEILLSSDEYSNTCLFSAGIFMMFNKSLLFSEASFWWVVYCSSIILWSFPYCLSKCHRSIENRTEDHLWSVVPRWYAYGQKGGCIKSWEVCCHYWTEPLEDRNHVDLWWFDPRWYFLNSYTSLMYLW